MTKVAILPIPTGQGGLSYRAIAGEKHAQDNTAGEVLDALTAQLSADEASTLVIVQSLRPDRFFTAAQQARLAAVDAPRPVPLVNPGRTTPWSRRPPASTALPLPGTAHRQRWAAVFPLSLSRLTCGFLFLRHPIHCS